MKLTLQVQVLPTAEERRLLLDTMKAFNAAASYAARVGFADNVHSQPPLHHRCYYKIREQYGLSAQMTVRAIAKAVEVFRRDKTRCPIFKPYGAITYDERILSWKGLDRVSIWTLEGRKILPIVYGEYQSVRLNRLKGQVDLVYRNKRFYLFATVDMPEGVPIEPTEFLGVDLGIVNLATTSDGVQCCGKMVERARQRHHSTRRSLGKKMGVEHKRHTRRNAKCAIKRIGNREQRFRRHVNHCISRMLVDIAKDSERGIAIEDLGGIRDRTRFRREQRAKVSGWAFAQLRGFVEYKAALAGVPVVLVDPRNTSRTCSRCGHCEKANRPDQATFRCQACGYTANADVNAAINIARGAAVNQPEVPEPHQILSAA